MTTLVWRPPPPLPDPPTPPPVRRGAFARLRIRWHVITARPVIPRRVADLRRDLRYLLKG